jgi:hypothetical protein
MERMKKIIFASTIIFLILVAGEAWAHQPRIVSQDLIEVQNPEISQAFYGELQGQPTIFRIDSPEPFVLYLNLLVPDLPEIEKDVSARVFFQDKELYFLNGLETDWNYFFEEFAGDGYYQGPEVKEEVEKGEYQVEVFSPDNQGKYVLAVGEKEEFPFDETVNTLLLLPQLKAGFFNKSPLTAYFNLVGLFLLIPLIILLVISLSFFFFLRKKKTKKKDELE